MDHSARIRQHFSLLARALTSHNPCWPSGMDARTGLCLHEASRTRRCYRSISAPGGSTLYWDLPLLRVASLLGAEERKRVLSYIRHWLEHAIAPNGLILWGNHYFLDADGRTVMRFLDHEAPRPVDWTSEAGDLHEIRPLPVDWDLLAEADASLAQRAARAALGHHMVSTATGEFNRHADRSRGFPFLEAGGDLVQTATWLYTRTGDTTHLQKADRIVDYVWTSRHPETGLIPVQQVQARWDREHATSETGFWALRLLEAAQQVPAPFSTKWNDIAETCLRAWTDAAWQPAEKQFAGRIRAVDGEMDTNPKETPYQPGVFSDPLEPLFPTHDYPLACARASLHLARLTGGLDWEEVCMRWRDVVSREVLSPRGQSTACADHYGHVIEFLIGMGDHFGARKIAKQAVEKLWVGPGFASHPGEPRCDAVDGPGILFNALLTLETHA